jgi:hypothetical protein
MLRVVSKLLDKGISVARLKESLTALREFHPEITKTSLPGDMLFTDGQRVYFKNRGDIIEDVIRGQYAFGFIVELKGIRREVLRAGMSQKSGKRQRSGT